MTGNSLLTNNMVTINRPKEKIIITNGKVVVRVNGKKKITRVK